jgi:hypothetical protein
MDLGSLHHPSKTFLFWRNEWLIVQGNEDRNSPL